MKWIKLWPDEWLNGTLRFTLDHKKRAVWTDLLCLAGRSRFPGVICAGEESGRLIGYPAEHIAGITLVTPTELSEILGIFEAQSRITVDRENGRLVIRITNWKKYQSEYNRQKGYRAAPKKVTPKVTATVATRDHQKLHVEVEEEVEEEKRQDAPKIGAPAAQAQPRPSPLSFAGQHFQVNENQDRLLAEAFPWVDRWIEYRKIDSWLEGNPEKRPRKASRFLHNWFTKILPPSSGKGDSSAISQRNRRSPGAVAAAPGKYDSRSPDHTIAN